MGKESELVERLRLKIYDLEQEVSNLKTKRGASLPSRFVISAIQITGALDGIYANSCTVKLQRDLEPVVALGVWISFVPWQKSQRRISKPAVGKVGAQTKVGLTKGFDRRISDYLTTHNTDLLLWDESHWDKEKGLLDAVSGEICAKKKREVRREVFPTLGPDDRDKYMRGCDMSLAAVLELVRSDSWEEIV